ncbi:MAG TPA: DNA repair protein RecO [Bacteroidales bacterium]|nr:DNA repair protein RecO [Bacteroidales bacterium]
MLEKTEGIVLHTIKYSDSGIISHIFTKKYGRLSFMAKGVRNKKGMIRKAYFQPLQPLSIEFYYREKKDLHIIKEASPLFNYINLHYDIRRNSMILFLGEVLYKALRPAGPDEKLYEFLIDSLDYLDNESNLIPNFHIGFIIGLTKYLGIAPSNNYSTHLQYFDMQNGVYTADPPLHGYYMGKEYSLLLNNFLESNITECNNMHISGSTRRDFLNDILGFYSLHLPGFKNIKSLKIYSEIYNRSNA